MKFTASYLVAVMAATSAVAAPAPDIKSRDPMDDAAPRNDDPAFISAVMRAHWYWRRLHCAQDLVWDQDLANEAQRDVNKCPQHQTHVRLPLTHLPSTQSCGPLIQAGALRQQSLRRRALT
jgi:hypothetical protein